MTSKKTVIDESHHDNLDLQLDRKFMKIALELAQLSENRGEVPIGALIVDKSGNIISKSTNLRESIKSTLGHAELVAIHRACKKLNSWRLIDCTLYVTLEPCHMCAGALVQSRISRVVFAAHDPKAGALGSLQNLAQHEKLNHRFEVSGGLMAEKSSEILKAFFRKKRSQSKR